MKNRKLTQAQNKLILSECAYAYDPYSFYRLLVMHTHRITKRAATLIVPYLIVPVGDGIGEAKLESDCGMFMRRGGKTFVLGGLGTRFGVLSPTNDVKRTFTFVDGNRSTQLKIQII